MKTALARYAAFFAAAFVGGAAHGFEEKAEAALLPAPVDAAVAKAFPKAKIVESELEDDDDASAPKTYEIELKDGEREISLAMSLDGEILEIERKVAFTGLPAAVKKAISAAHPKDDVEEVEEVVRGDATFYEVEFEGDAPEMILDAEGRTIAKPALAETPAPAQPKP